jgi:YVTN family beta-propeller protein
MSNWKNPRFALLFFLVMLLAPSAFCRQISFPLNSQGSYIFLNTVGDPSNPGAPPDVAVPPLIINLASLGVNPGETIRVSTVGDFSYFLCPSGATGCTSLPEAYVPSCGVFSSSNVVGPPNLLNRVPGAIAPDFSQVSACVTPPTLFGGFPTDIPQDFVLNGSAVTVPANAAFLIVAVPDSYYADNGDPNGDLRVSLSVPQTAPYAYVGSNSSANCCLNVYNTATNALVTTIPITGLGEPFGITPDQSRLYVADYNDNLIGVIDTASSTLATAFPAPGGPNAVVITPDGKFGYIADFDGTVGVFSVATNSIVTRIPVGFSVGWVTVTPDGASVYASGWSDTIAVISTASNTVTSTFTVPISASQTAAGCCLWGPFPNPSGTLGYILQADSTPGATAPGTVSAYSLPGNTPVAAISVGTRPFDAAMSPDGSHLYVANAFSGTISVIDTATNTVSATIPVGLRPASLATTPDGSLLYVANEGDNTLSIVQTSSDTVTATIPVTTPFGILIANPPPPSQATTLSANPPNLLFSSQLIGTTSNAQSISVGNPSTSPVTLTSATLTGPNASEFLLNNNCPQPPATLAGGATCTIQVSFEPLVVGARTALVTLAVNNGVVGSEQSIPLSGTGTAPAPTVTTIPLTFTPGTNVSRVATLNCPSGTVPCTDPNAHSLKLTVPQVTTPFTLTVTAYEVSLSEANGICENGQTESTDFDCRFASYFPIQTDSNGDVVVPQCIPYSNGNCVFYRVGNTPPTSYYQGPVYEYIAWNNEAYVPLPIYQANNPRLFDDPDDPPYNVNHQFVFDITDTYQPTGQYVGLDSGIGGLTLHFNDFVVAYPGAPKSSYSFKWVPPLSASKPAYFEAGDSILARFKLSPDTPPGVAMDAPNRAGYSVLLDTSNTGCSDFTGVRQPTRTPRNWPTNFSYDPVRQLYQLKLQGIYKPGRYKLLVNSNLLPEQCAPFVVTKD